MKKVVTDVSQLQSGMRVKCFFGEGNSHNETIHIRAIVDDEVFVVARWSQRKGYYKYSCEDIGLYRLYVEEKKFTLTITGKNEEWR